MNKVLITGAGGFIGSHLVEKCVEDGFDVKAFVHYNSKNNWGWLEHSKVKNEIEVITGDIRDYDSVFNALDNCETVFHLAALIGIPYSYTSPLAYIKTNIEGTYNVLQASKERNLSKVLITSTSETYGTAQFVPIDETHPLVGQSPYSASKIAADQIALSYHKSFGLPVSIVRPFNTYGPRQSARAIIPTIIAQIVNGIKKIKLGDLTPTRDFNYVKDTIAGLLAIANCNETIGKEINIASNYEISMRDTLDIIKGILQSDIEFVTDKQRIRPENSEVFRLWGDNKLITTLTNWRPKYSIEQGLRETIEWFTKIENLKKYKANIYNI